MASMSVSPNIRTIRWLCLVVTLCLLSFGWIYAVERTTTFDSAFYVWLMLDGDGPVAFHDRIGAWLPQLPALPLISMGSPLIVVLRTYSVCLLLLPLLVLGALAGPMRDSTHALGLVLLLLVGLRSTFYFGISEVNLGIAWCAMVGALLHRSLTASHPWGWWSVAVLCAVWSTLHHPVLILATMASAGCVTVANNAGRRLFVPLIVMAGSMVLRMVLIGGTAYEKGRMPTLPLISDQIGHLGELASTGHLLSSIGTFALLFLLIIITTIGLLVTRQWMLLLWTLVISVGSGVLILLADRNVGTVFMYENFYPVLAWCWTLPAARVLLRALEHAPRATTFLLSAFVVMGIAHVHQARSTAVEKVRYAERLTGALRQQGIRKAVLDARCLPWGTVHADWTLPMETALVSALQGADKAVTCYATYVPDTLGGSATRTGAFLGPSWQPGWFDARYLNKRYLDLPDGAYRLVNQRGPWHPERTPGVAEITILVPEGVLSFGPEDHTAVPVRLLNRTGVMLQSLDTEGEPLRLRAVVLSPKQAPLVVDPDPGPMELDIPPWSHIPQSVLVPRPSRSGIHWVTVDLMQGGRTTGVRAGFWMRAWPLR